MKKTILRTSVAGILAASAGTATTAQADIFDELLLGAKPLVNARLRYETVSQVDRPEDANSVTMRLRAGAESGAVNNTSIGIQFEWLQELNSDFNSTRNGKTQFPVVADPEDVEVNLLYIKNTSLPDTTVTLGRQRIVYDDARFIGDVIWRQNQQTYDAVSLTNTSIKNLTVNLAYVEQVNRIFGRGAGNGRFDASNIYVNAAYKTPIGKLTGFGYFLDLENGLRLSTQTLGVRFIGSQKVGGVKIDYVGSAATQSDYGDNPVEFTTEYFAAELGAGYNGFIGKAGFELLGSDEGAIGFSTPLSTAHKFQGFADLFLATPDGGVEDYYAKVGYSKKNVGPFSVVKAIFAYHDFSSSFGDVSYGDELDFYITAKWQRFLFGVKFGEFYESGDVGVPGNITSRRRLTFDVNFKF
ncbi:MAG: alginate export family protein [Pseudomonadota bacterium]